jgi:hypothetical protein
MNVTTPTRPAATADVIRRLLLVLLVVALLATAVDLVLLEHYESSWMLVPFVMIGVALMVIAWHAVDGGPATVLALRVTMLMFIVTGALGIFLHYQANLEFQLDMDATQSSWSLFKKVMHAKAPPALAPGAMAQLGLIGWLYCFRHPVLADRDQRSPTSTGA